MRPKISTVYPFDYDKLIKKSKFAFINKYCGSNGNTPRPVIITSIEEDMIKGHTFAIFKDGIEINSDISMPKENVDMETITRDANSLICNWLEEVDNDLYEK